MGLHRPRWSCLPGDRRPTRQGARRLLGPQRHRRDARPPERHPRLAGARPRRLDGRGRHGHVQGDGEHAGWRRRLPRPDRTVPDPNPQVRGPDALVARVHRCGSGGGVPRGRGLQRARSERRRRVPGQRHRRGAAEHRPGLSHRGGPQPPQPQDLRQCARRSRPVRRATCDRRRHGERRRDSRRAR